MLSSSECITWFAVVLVVSVAIVTVNLLSIILFIKNSDLRTRSMYLVINLTVADTLVGVISKSLHRQYLWQSYSLLCLFVICACYASIIVKICCEARPQHHGAARRQRKLTLTLLIMTIVSLLLWLPFAVATFVYY
ncbi:unnamed protein product, partial [Porites evermanni]